jgi:ketosteroid isomerase-like protein
VRRAYRGITPDQERGFTQFFDAARSLRATFSVADVTVTGPGAEARVVGAYDYVTADGKRQHQPVTFVATLRHEGGTWRLMGVR